MKKWILLLVPILMIITSCANKLDGEWLLHSTAIDGEYEAYPAYPEHTFTFSDSMVHIDLNWFKDSLKIKHEDNKIVFPAGHYPFPYINEVSYSGDTLKLTTKDTTGAVHTFALVRRVIVSKREIARYAKRIQGDWQLVPDKKTIESNQRLLGFMPKMYVRMNNNKQLFVSRGKVQVDRSYSLSRDTLISNENDTMLVSFRDDTLVLANIVRWRGEMLLVPAPGKITIDE